MFGNFADTSWLLTSVLKMYALWFVLWDDSPITCNNTVTIYLESMQKV